MTNLSKKVGAFFLAINICLPLQAVSLVYNMKIRRAFKLGFMHDKSKKLTWVVTALPIVYKLNRSIFKEKSNLNPLIDICEKRLNSGVLFNVRAISTDNWWIEFTTGLEKEKLKSTGTSNFVDSRKGLDDFVFSAGYNVFPTDEFQITSYVITGLPTYRKVTELEAQGVLLGTRCFSLGAGTEFSYALIDTLKNNLVLIFQNRFLHFFSRKWSPILPCSAKIQPGNVTDFLFSVQFRQNRDIFETGYDGTLFSNQALLLKSGTVKSDNFLRNSYYLTYAHVCQRFPLTKRQVIAGMGFSAGRISKVIPTTIISCWGNITIIF